MKKNLLVVCGLIMVLMVTGCGKSKNVEEENQPVKEYVYSINDIYGKTSFTLEDLSIIADEKFPTSYSYVIYQGEWEESAHSGEYVYPSDMSHDLLLPEYVNVVSSELVSSRIENDMVDTVVKATTYDGREYSILYINDPETLRYLAASVDDGETVVLYTFRY